MLREVFSFFDKESAGVMKTADLALAIRSAGFLVVDAEVRQMVSKYDPEQSGVIDVR